MILFSQRRTPKALRPVSLAAFIRYIFFVETRSLGLYQMCLIEQHCIKVMAPLSKILKICIIKVVAYKQVMFESYKNGDSPL